MFFYFLVLSVLAFDQITKLLAIKYLAPSESWPLIPGIFHLTFVENTGIAFGLFRQHQPILIGLITISLIGLLIWGSKSKSFDLPQRIGLALILGGAVGNWIDRVRLGAVIDFLDFRVWPVFNIADSAITVGVVIYMWLFLKGDKKKKREVGS